MGFCLFNNVAVAAQLAIDHLGVRRVFILDWDVHHGNGTDEIFRHRDDVLFASIHQANTFPHSGPLRDAGSGRGLGYTINLPVPPGSDGERWLSLLEYVVLPAAIAFRPELILISAGFDAHRADPLGGCQLESADFARMARHVSDLAAVTHAPIGAVLEGGYDPPALAESVIATMRALASATPPSRSRRTSSTPVRRRPTSVTTGSSEGRRSAGESERKRAWCGNFRHHRSADGVA